jgi:hypothetical protein
MQSVSCAASRRVLRKNTNGIPVFSSPPICKYQQLQLYASTKAGPIALPEAKKKKHNQSHDVATEDGSQFLRDQKDGEEEERAENGKKKAFIEALLASPSTIDNDGDR